jgi:isoleucyl-tRNA synthetase
MKRWIVTCVDCGETCDGKARTLGVFKEREEARAFVRNDIERWADDHAGEGIEVDFDKMSATYDYDTDNGCEWNIEEVEIPM